LSIWDFVILIILLAGAYRGYQKGLLRAVVGFVALIAGILGAIMWTPEGIAFLSQRFDISGEILPVLAFLAIFSLIVLVLSLIGRLVKLVIDLTPIGALDGLVGALLGLFKWALGISIVLWILDKAEVGLPVADEDSALLTNVRMVAPYMFQQLIDWSPFFDEIIKNVGEMLSRLKH
jgi:membrane protein required for colicin V production